jgi:hypothetical protein
MELLTTKDVSTSISVEQYIYQRNKEASLMTRVLAGTIFINGTEDESWSLDNETVSTSRTVQGTYLDLSQPAVRIGVDPVSWGGECRVEIDIDARVVDGDQIQIEGNVKLFEGASEDSQDLEEEKRVEFLVPKTTKSRPEPAHHNVQLTSRGIGGGDHAEISFSFTNRIGEE